MSNGKPQLCLKGSTRNTITVHQTAHGTTRSLEHLVQNLEETAIQAHDHLIQSRERLVDLNQQVDQPFEYATWLAELAAKQQKLVAKLDLNRDRNSMQLKEIHPQISKGNFLKCQSRERPCIGDAD